MLLRNKVVYVCSMYAISAGFHKYATQQNAGVGIKAFHCYNLFVETAPSQFD